MSAQGPLVLGLGLKGLGPGLDNCNKLHTSKREGKQNVMKRNIIHEELMMSDRNQKFFSLYILCRCRIIP